MASLSGFLPFHKFHFLWLLGEPSFMCVCILSHLVCVCVCVCVLGSVVEIHKSHHPITPETAEPPAGPGGPGLQTL